MPARAEPCRRNRRVARWIDLGDCPADVFHATYAGLARAQSGRACPIVVWGRPRAHVCIGQGQDRNAELVREPGAPVVRRALGGGAVWIDGDQCCAVLIDPRAASIPERAAWTTWAIRPAVETLRSFGLPAIACDRDIWIRGRKIAGSGAATIGAAAVLGFSFMLRFARSRFAAAIALPHEGLRGWLNDGLMMSVTDWRSEGDPPSSAQLTLRFRQQVERWLGWSARDSAIRHIEATSIAEARGESDEEWVHCAPRRTPDGVKLNARSYLVGYVNAGMCYDSLVVDGHLVRTAVHGHADP